uniref:Uncharacterized protein n=1 Tax=Moniliophthora roreri TaxID=221103 RepID=A0A0W0G8U8_MONRR
MLNTPPLPASLEECLRATPGLQFKGNPASSITPNSTDHPMYCIALDLIIHLLTPSADNLEPLCLRAQSLSINNNQATSEKLLLQFAESRSPSNVKAFLGADESNAPRLSATKQLVIGFKKGY